ncbi:TPR end-of-group domain-containing protein [Flavobacterium sp.]|uniref:TPR end-of-group domain-containing protein n=1 Tax=Flavobacterium sp. TaxID=239 RepID=UPI0039E5C074
MNCNRLFSIGRNGALWILLLVFSPAIAQVFETQKADSLYRAKSFIEAGKYYQKSGDLGWMKALKKNGYYNAACSFALAHDTEKAFENLNLLVSNGYANKAQLEADQDLATLHTDARWPKLINAVKRRFGDSPHNAKFITADLANFYRAFDLALKDSAKAKTIFRKEYFVKGSDGLQDFFVTKIRDEDQFVKTIFKYKDFYAKARHTVLQTTAIKGPVYKNAAVFEDLYPQAVFPDVYFLIGKFNSNGTISDNGLLIGTEQMSKTPDTDTSNWNAWQREWIMDFSHIPVTVAHELVHFNQDGMKRENSLLCYAMIEGSAEFVAALITGETDGDYTAFKGREQQIWQDFKNERQQDLYSEWIQASDKRPRNALYWAGYLISKAYYENASDKKQAIYDLLHIQDYEAFYQKSQVETFVKAIN